LFGILALLLAYKNGHGQLCRALVVAGANLSICNDDSFSIFTMPTASKALLVNILGKREISVGSIELDMNAFFFE